MPNYINDLKDNLTFALANVALRNEILADVNKYAPEAISDAELVQIYQFVLFIISKSHVKSHLETMSQDGGKIISRSTKDADYPKSPPLPRSLLIRRDEQHIRVGFVENSKTTNGKKSDLKLKRSVTTVSRILDVTPGMITRVVPLTTKSYTLGQALPAYTTIPRTRPSTFEEATAIKERKQKIVELANANAIKKADAWRTALRHIHTAQKTGLNALVCDTYTKKTGMQAVRTIEPWTSTNLFTIRPLMATWSPEFVEGFVYDTVIKLLTQIYRMHNELQIVHGDIFPETIGFTINNNTKPKLKFKDFENSATFAELSGKYPVSRSAFCSPKVVEFNLFAQEGIRSDTLCAQFSAPMSGGGYDASFARESFETSVMLHGIDDPASLYHPDYVHSLRYGTDDDMYSLGITLFALITGCYPTVSGLQGQAYGDLHYLRVQDAYMMYPQYAPLLKGLLSLDRDRRLTAEQALMVFNQIPDPHARATSAETVEVAEIRLPLDDSGSTSTSTGDTVSPPTTSLSVILPSTKTPPLLDSETPPAFKPSAKSAFKLRGGS